MLHTVRKLIDMYYQLSTQTRFMCSALPTLLTEVFHHHSDFKYTADLILSSLFKKPGRKSRFLKFLADYIATSEVKFPPVPVSKMEFMIQSCVIPCYSNPAI